MNVILHTHLDICFLHFADLGPEAFSFFFKPELSHWTEKLYRIPIAKKKKKIALSFMQQKTPNSYKMNAVI